MDPETLATPHSASSGSPREAPLPAQIRELCREGHALWEHFYYDARGEHCRDFVAADYRKVYRALRKLRGRAITFLEWGSGTGVVTIMADLLGFEAYGIEIEPRLTAAARELAARFGSRARFATGSFVPEDYEWNRRHGDPNFHTALECRPGYDELDMELRDFDLVYAYPWPDEEPLFHDIMRRCGRRNALFLTFGAFEGIELHRPGRRRRRR